MRVVVRQGFYCISNFSSADTVEASVQLLDFCFGPIVIAARCHALLVCVVAMLQRLPWTGLIPDTWLATNLRCNYTCIFTHIL